MRVPTLPVILRPHHAQLYIRLAAIAAQIVGAETNLELLVALRHQPVERAIAPDLELLRCEGQDCLALHTTARLMVGSVRQSAVLPRVGETPHPAAQPPALRSAQLRYLRRE